MRFIAFDLETTGTVPGVDQIVEIGAVRFNGSQIDGVFSTLIDPLRPIPPGASAVNGISNDMVKGKPTIDTILESFTDFCQEDFLVAHNAPFDSQFLTADYKKLEFPTPRGLILDTLPIARKVFPGLPNYKLGTLIQHLKIPASNFHRAEEDATYCGNLFLEMVKRISINGQPPAIQNLIALTGKPESRFPIIEKKPKQMDLFGSLL
ncbi:MAG: DNA polymerase III subunit epsilon [Bdellovibrio sp. CG10_big_fil_rev_8_21_14_0_10_47_8]|nr:MAG: DNA polymerase III subunit epsilon [Bdellovibrio sp. CG10_big_fil_rev_8_21_14_0_10_47_8]